MTLILSLFFTAPALAAYGWTVTEEQVIVSEHELWTSRQPDVLVDADGRAWLGFASRYEGERYHTAGTARRDADGWQLQRDRAEMSFHARLAHGEDGAVAVFAAGGAASPVLDGGGTVPGEVFRAFSDRLAWGKVGRSWARFERGAGGQWVAWDAGVFEDNSYHPNAITARGPVLRMQRGETWSGYYLLRDSAPPLQVLATAESHDVYAIEEDGALVVLAQPDIGGGDYATEPVVLLRETRRGFEQTEVARMRGERPGCPEEALVCEGQVTRSRALGLTPAGPILLEQTVPARWQRACVQPVGSGAFPAEDTPQTACAEHGDWMARPSLGREILAERVTVGGQPLALAHLPPGDDIGLAWDGEVLHMAWYEAGTIRYVAARRSMVP